MSGLIAKLITSILPERASSGRNDDGETLQSTEENEVTLDSPDSPTSTNQSVDGSFQPAMNAINFEALKEAAVVAYKKNSLQQSENALTSALTNLTCSINEPPQKGGYNLVYTLSFSNGAKWIARIPGCAVETWEEDEVNDFMTRIRTTKLLRAETEIPIPEIYHWNASKENLVGVPYTLEAFIEGEPLYEVWTDKERSNEDWRRATLRRLARIMAQLHHFEFRRVGAMEFDQDGNHTRIGPVVSPTMDVEETSEGEKSWGRLKSSGPFPSLKTYLLRNLAAPEIKSPSDMLDWGVYELLHLLVESVPQRLNRSSSAVLAHPDFSYENIFVDKDGNINALIDWDHVHTLPRVLGYPSYPGWLTVDWDPTKYNYGDYGYDSPDLDDSPAQLLRYRRIYAGAFAEVGLPPDKYQPEDTTLSIIVSSILIAINDEAASSWVLMWLLDWAFDGEPPCTLKEYCETYLAGQADEWTVLIKEAFGNMWHEETLDPDAYQERWVKYLERCINSNRGGMTTPEV